MRIFRVLVLVFLFGTVSAFAQTGGVTQAQDETPSAWFVELGSAPLADVDAAFTTTQKADYVRKLKAEKDAFRNAARAAGIQLKERRAFDVLWNGLAVEIASGQLSKLSRMIGVKNLYPILTFSIPETQPMELPELATALAMTGADVAQSELGLTGAGVKVAVMDTGVDYHHPDLGGGFGPAYRVITGWDFVGNAFNADPASPGYNPNPAPDPDPDDCNGHGTHVAGIVGAYGAVVGVAPGVKFGAYRVFGCEGSTTADIMIAAMERLLADGMQVLNMSIGSAFQWPQYPTAEAADRLVNKGVSVVASIGNSGANGAYSAGAPGLGKKVIGVASFDNSHINALTFTVNPSGRRVPYLPLATTPDPPTSGTTPEIVFVGRGCSAPFDPYLADPSGKIALIVRGLCTFNEKYQRAANAGAVGVLIYNSGPGLFAGGGVLSRDIFGISISQADGQHISGLTSPTLTWTDIRVNAPNPTGGLISSFSSYGLSPDLVVKPDIGAPGGLIRSTYPVERGSYATISGTSMSSPHVAGGVALLLQARPQTSAQAVRSILQNSADPKLWFGNPGLGFLDNVHRQGSGMLDIDDAIRATTKIEPGKLSVGEGDAGPRTFPLTIENNATGSVAYTLSHVAALATGGNTFNPGFFTSFGTVSFSANPLSVPAKSKGTVDVTITPPATAGRQYGGYIVITGGGATYRVPYGGFSGDYQAIVAMNPTACSYPFLAKTGGTTACSGTAGPITGFTKQPTGATYTLLGDDIPHILLHLDHQVARLRLEVFEAASGRVWHRALDLRYVGRNSAATSFFDLPWDGTTVSGNRVLTVPNGTYVIKLSILKALGDESNPAHWETWTSPAITIARP